MTQTSLGAMPLSTSGVLSCVAMRLSALSAPRETLGLAGGALQSVINIYGDLCESLVLPRSTECSWSGWLRAHTPIFAFNESAETLLAPTPQRCA